jgi:hypothetical protein
MKQKNKIISSTKLSLEDKFKNLNSLMTVKESTKLSILLGNTVLDLCKTELPDNDVASEAYEAVVDYYNSKITFDELNMKRNAVIYAIQDALDEGVKCPATSAVAAMIQSVWIYDKTLNYKGSSIDENDNVIGENVNVYTEQNAIDSSKFASNVFIEHLFKATNGLNYETNQIKKLLETDVKKLVNGNV